MLNKIWEWIKSIDKKVLITSIIECIFFIFIISSINQCSNKKIDALDQNLAASRDQIETLMLENGSLISERSAYILKANQLEEMLEITKEEKKDIERKLDDKIAYIANIESKVKIDTIEVKDTVIVEKDNSLNIQWSYQDKWLSMNGGTLYDNGKSNTTISNINMYTPLRVGMTDNYKIFVESPNPYLRITDIEGAIIDGSRLKPKYNYWTLSVQGGFGAQYGLVHNQFDLGPYVGVGVSYNFKIGK